MHAPSGVVCGRGAVPRHGGARAGWPGRRRCGALNARRKLWVGREGHGGGGGCKSRSGAPGRSAGVWEGVQGLVC